MKKFFSGKRLYIILAVAAILGIIVAVRSCSSKVEPDLVISYVGENLFSSDKFYENIPTLRDVIDDVNGDGKKEIELATITFTTNITASQEQANMSKMNMSMGMGESRLYLMDKQYCQHYADTDSEFIMDLTGLIPDGMDVITNDQGKIYGVSVENNAVLEKLGLDTTEVYASLRAITKMDHINFKNPGPEEMNKAAEDVLLYIINFKDEEM